MCTHLPYNCHLPSLEWARLRHTKVACHTSWIVDAPALTDLETRRFGILLIHNYIRRAKKTRGWEQDV